MTEALPKTWTVLEVLRWTTAHFRDKGVSEPRASAEVLLAHTLGASRLDLYLRYDQPLAAAELARFKALLRRRLQGEPTAYLTGHKEFWSLDFLVTPAVLIPRPETEGLVAAALAAARQPGGWGQGPPPHAFALAEPSAPPPIQEAEQLPTDDIFYRKPKTENRKPILGLEVGVGSGAVLVALARELPESRWLGVDISAAALALAGENARRHGVAQRLRLVRADLLSAIKPRAAFDLLVANLPYVPRREWEKLPKDVRDFEPRQALLGGEDGLDLVRRLIAAAPPYLAPGAWLLLEVGHDQAAQVMGLLAATHAFADASALKDYHGIPRVVQSRLK
jgi:release factor glutamine methyltransferase